jgi:hypothetical protein
MVTARISLHGDRASRKFAYNSIPLKNFYLIDIKYSGEMKAVLKILLILMLLLYFLHCLNLNFYEYLEEVDAFPGVSLIQQSS